MIYLDRNEYNFAPSKEVIEAAKNFDIKKLCFYTRDYDSSPMVDYLAEETGINNKNILLGYGGEDILNQAVHYYLEKNNNKKILIPKYSWWYYKSIAEEVDGITYEYEVYEDGNSFKYDYQKISQQIEEVNPAVIMLATPNNPTGNALSIEELEQFISIIPKDIVILIDEAYSSYVNDDDSYIKILIEKYPNIILIRTLSKFYGLPGLRLGFAFISDNLNSFIKYGKKYLGYNRFSEEVGMAALQSKSHYKKVASEMSEGRNLFKNELSDLKGFKVYDSLANFVFIKYPLEIKDTLEKELNNLGIKIKFMNEEHLNSHLRITLGPIEYMKEIVNTIKKISK
ncbi:histidinol-phosphate aminotransferase family protein [Marinilabiliaceae bacterium JC040]|nr:histidinol-phosphate aminotransferase family protein [Marinilabiliaceae bacterium JC040]